MSAGHRPALFFQLIAFVPGLSADIERLIETLQVQILF